ncbi:hypothetical protein OF83DRAFT_1167102 [Amylostereum chailletii]|nr:hypothetical protein OF83DRAFT_1167102 [Amylostereum chailletii]
MSPVHGTVALNTYLQSVGKQASLSWIDVSEGPVHAPMWTCTCKVDGQAVATGTGTHKHLARDAAADKALPILTRST